MSIPGLGSSGPSDPFVLAEGMLPIGTLPEAWTAALVGAPGLPDPERPVDPGGPDPEGPDLPPPPEPVAPPIVVPDGAPAGRTGETYLLIADLDGETIYLSTNGFHSDYNGLTHAATRRTIPPHQLFPARLLNPINASASLVEGQEELGSRAVQGFGTVRIQESADAVPRSWRNREIEIYRGRLENQFSSFDAVFRGSANRASNPDLHTLEVQLRDRGRLLDEPVQQQTYDGMGAALRGSSIPSRVSVGHHPSCYIDDTLTVEARFRSFSDPGVDVAIGSWGDGGMVMGGNLAWALWLGADRRLHFRQERGTSNAANFTSAAVSADSLSDGLWHHFAVVRDVQGSEIRFYHDGEMVGTSAYNHSTQRPDGGEDGRMWIGRADLIDHAAGDLDEIRVWRKVRTAEELRENRNHQISGASEGLAGYYRCNESLGVRTFDEVSVTNLGRKTLNAVRLNGSTGRIRLTGFRPQINDFSVRLVIFPWEEPELVNEHTEIFGDDYSISIRFSRTDGNLQARVRSSSGAWTRFIVGSLPWERRWFYLDVTYDGDRLRVYESGAIEGSTGAPATRFLAPPGAVSYFGQWGARRGGMWIAEAAFFTRARSAEEIAGDWNARLLGSEEGLEAHWLFDETEGEVVGDHVNSWDGEITDGVWHDTTGNFNSDGPLSTGISWTGSGTGGEELSGKRLPTLSGTVRHAELFEVDPAQHVWQLHDGPITGVTAAYVGGLPLATAATPVHDLWEYQFSSDEDYLVSNTRGLVRFRQSPVLPPTVDATGFSGDRVYQVFEELARGHGIRIDTSTFEALDGGGDHGVRVGIQTGNSPVGLIPTLNLIMRSIHGAWSFRRTGEIFGLQFIEPSTGEATIDLGPDDITVAAVRRHPIPSTWRQTVLYARYPGHLRSADVDRITFTDDRAQADVQEEWREVAASDETVLDRFPGAGDVRTRTAILDEEDARSEASARLALFGVERALYEIGLVKPLNSDLGDIVRLTLPRFGLDGGRQFIVVGWTEDRARQTYRVTLWG